jgi:hypothetical protein
MSTTEKRSAFDWIMFLAIHLILIGGIAYAGFSIYGERLGVWVAASALVAGFTSTYLYAKIVPGETIMKVILGLAVAANAAYMVHNGAKAIGITAYNDAQIKKYEAGMAAAAGATSKAIARTIGASAKDASAIERTFSDGVSTVAALLAFLEMSLAIIFFAVASKRVSAIERGNDPQPMPQALPPVAAPPALLPQMPQRPITGFATGSTNFSTGGNPTNGNGATDPKV